MILEITRSHVRLLIDGRTVTVGGEAYLRGYGSPDFVAYANSFDNWDPPFDGETIDGLTKQRILNAIVGELAARGMTCEIE